MLTSMEPLGVLTLSGQQFIKGTLPVCNTCWMEVVPFDVFQWTINRDSKTMVLVDLLQIYNTHKQVVSVIENAWLNATLNPCMLLCSERLGGMAASWNRF